MKMPDPDNEEEPFDFYHLPEESKWNRFVWLVSFPLEFIFFLTIPNVRRSCAQSCSCLGLTISILWISLLTYLCSWTITVIGE